MNKDYLVTKSNYFIMNCNYDLTLEEQKIILTLASMVQPDDEEFKSYKFRIIDFMNLLGVSTKTKYTEIPRITKELMKKVFEIKEEKRLIQTAWLSSVIYEKGSGYVELTFSPALKPYMLRLNSMFTQYKLSNVLLMKSKYSPRLYEILKCNEFKKQGFIEISVSELRSLLKVENIYPLYADFKRKVIVKSQIELKKLSDLYFDFEEIKTGRKVTTIRFYIHSNKIKNTNNITNEVSVTTLENEKSVQSDLNEDGKIFELYNLFKDYKVGFDSIKKILYNANGDIDKVKRVYEYSKTQNIDNFVGFMLKMVKDDTFIEPKGLKKNLKFNNFKQREYDYEELENKLLGWD